MADAKPSRMHGEDSHSDIPTKDELPKARKALEVLHVSGKVVNLVAETKLDNGTIRRDYE